MKRVDIKYMGYSIRTDDWRYTVWLPFNGTANRGIWNANARDGDSALMEELYSHRGDNGTDFDAFENENLAGSLPADCAALFARLRSR